jgi:hypothetical protein
MISKARRTFVGGSQLRLFCDAAPPRHGINGGRDEAMSMAQAAVAQVDFAEWMENNHLRHSRFGLMIPLGI